MADDKEEFSGKSEGPRVYGAADDSNRQTPPEQGMRGEKASTDSPAGDLTHTESALGHPIMVEESSGTAFAAATGRAGPETMREKGNETG